MPPKLDGLQEAIDKNTAALIRLTDVLIAGGVQQMLERSTTQQAKEMKTTKRRK
jgi:hypothetical protein